jgi:CHAT domain-containing protein/tetratricopeptide (TPR) repeat protein
MRYFRCLVILVLAAFSFAAMGQNSDAESSFKRLSQEEAVNLRAVLAQPVPTSASNANLAEHFRAKRNAAERLGEIKAQIALYEQWVAALPQDLLAKNQLALKYSDLGRYDEAIQLRRAIVDASKSDHVRAWYQLALGWTLRGAGKFDEAMGIALSVKASIATLKSQFRQQADRPFVARIEAIAFRLESNLLSDKGKFSEARVAAEDAMRVSQDALRLQRELPNTSPAVERVYVNDLAFAYERLGFAFEEDRKRWRAEEVLKDFLRLAKLEELPPNVLADIHGYIGLLRYSQREFVQVEQNFRKKDAIYAQLGYDSLFPARANAREMIVGGLMGQKRWASALQELEHLDDLAKDDEAMKKRVRYPYTRGYVYLGNGIRLNEVVALMQEEADLQSKRYPVTDVYVAQARGLQAVALWRLGDAQSKSQALPLLKQSVRDYMLPEGAGKDPGGVRRDARNLIFSTYLEALFSTPGESPMDAMGPADWERGGSVQEALKDAAVRSAVSDPALATIVRQEQDAKNEIEALRKFLAADEGSRAPSPVIAAKMRDRISDLVGLRERLLAELRVAFPDFDRLVNPTPPAVSEVVKGLRDDEALLMLLPASDAVYVWAVGGDNKKAWARVEMPETQLNALVRSMRKTLDFGEMKGAIPAFDSAAASALYQRLLAPLNSVTRGKKHLIVAAGGALGGVPFGVLLTEPHEGSAASAPWLIRQAAITHVPSLSAWLAIRRFASTPSAPQALAAWGAPQFVVQVAEASPTTSIPPPKTSTATRKVNLTRATTAVDLERQDPSSAIRYSDIPALPETRDELVAIAGALRADVTTDLYLGSAATKASVLQSNQAGELRNKRVIAFATHGLMAGDLPGLSQPALALAATGKENSEPLGALLTLDEVLGLKLNADWVVLSACNTAAADGRAEEALSGLARGFFYAGSRSLLVTHWAVESESAKLLTSNTFAHYTANPAERKAESLRQATLKVMSMPQYQHPAFWAPYALVGDGGR